MEVVHVEIHLVDEVGVELIALVAVVVAVAVAFVVATVVAAVAAIVAFSCPFKTFSSGVPNGL